MASNPPPGRPPPRSFGRSFASSDPERQREAEPAAPREAAEEAAPARGAAKAGTGRGSAPVFGSEEVNDRRRQAR